VAVQSSTAPLSERVRRLKPSATFAVTARVRELEAAGVDVVGFGAGEPDFDTPEAIKSVAIEALRAGQTGYQAVAGPVEARAAIVRKLERENDIAATVDDVVISSGAKQSIFLALQALVDPGREVIVPTPAWVSYRPMIELAGGVVVEVPGAVADEFKISPAALDAAITPATCAVLINSPSNPCGTMYAPDELRALGSVLARHERVMVIADEIYEKLIYGDVAHFSLGSLPSIRDRVVTVNGLSKAYAMTGWRIGYACAPGEGIARAMAKLQGQMTSHATSFVYPAIAAALEDGAAGVETMRQTFAERAARMHALVSAMPGVTCPRPTGAFYVFPDVGEHFGSTSPQGRPIDSSLAFSEALLEEARVAVVPGEDFGACAHRNVRLGFACSLAKIEEGCRRMHEWLEKLG
jgi:aspartate aminotransferase